MKHSRRNYLKNTEIAEGIHKKMIKELLKDFPEIFATETAVVMDNPQEMR